MAFRFSQRATRLLLWPIRMLSRLTPDGGFFLALALLCGLASVGSNRWSNIPLLVCLVMLSLWLLAIWRGTQSLRGLTVRRLHAERTFANDPITVTLQVLNASRLPSAGVTLIEELESVHAAAENPGGDNQPRAARVPAARARTFVTVIAGKTMERARYSITIRRRGIYRFAQTILETAFPMGFFLSNVARRTPGRLVVYPRLGDVDTSFFKEMEVALQYIRRSRPSRAEEDIRGLREFRDGDNPKWIHWRSSARIQKLLVKEFEEPQARRVLLLLDTNLQKLGAQRFGAFELAISFAGTVARDLVRRNCEVECVALQPQGRIARTIVSRERRNLEALLEMLAGLRREDGRSLEDMMDQVRRRSLHHVFVMVLGLGSLRSKVNLSWLNTSDNLVKVFDARGDEFRKIFRRTGVSLRDDNAEEDLLLGMGDEEALEDVSELAGAKF